VTLEAILLWCWIFLRSEVWRGQSESGPQSICSVESVFAICSVTDMPRKQTEKDAKTSMSLTKGPSLVRKAIEEVTLGSMGEWSPSDPQVSTLVSSPDLKSLSESIKVDEVIAGGVVPAPNNAILRKKLAECGERTAWLSGRSRCIACPGVSISCARGCRRNGLDHIHPQYEYPVEYRYYLPIPRVIGSVPIFIEENRRDISELELRFAEVSGFLSVVATTVRGNAAAKDLSTAENIIRPEVLRLVSCRPRVLFAGGS
jgi:hypothetical protein